VEEPTEEEGVAEDSKQEHNDKEDASDEEEQQLDLDTIDVDNIDLSLLIKGKADHEYLESLTELEWEAILGERFERLKNEIDMIKALSIAASSAVVAGTVIETEGKDVGAPSPTLT
jgi:hypothetical protein